MHPTLYEMHYQLMMRFTEGFQSEDLKKAARAFIKKRKPEFKAK
jgi:enoyl-CoA hydratase/carnithine racemase